MNMTSAAAASGARTPMSCAIRSRLGDRNGFTPSASASLPSQSINPGADVNTANW